MAGVPIFAVLLLAAVTAGAAAQCSTGAEWELILSQAATAGVFPEPADVLDVDFNANEPGSLLFSNLSGLETRRSDDGLFYFRLQWPELCDNAEVFPCVNGSTAVVWAQSSNPLVTNTVTGTMAGELPEARKSGRGRGWWGEGERKEDEGKEGTRREETKERRTERQKKGEK